MFDRLRRSGEPAVDLDAVEQERLQPAIAHRELRERVAEALGADLDRGVVAADGERFERSLAARPTGRAEPEQIGDEGVGRGAGDDALRQIAMVVRVGIDPGEQIGEEVDGVEHGRAMTVVGTAVAAGATAASSPTSSSPRQRRRATRRGPLQRADGERAHERSVTGMRIVVAT